MGVSRKLDLDRRLEAYFATLRSASLRNALKRSVGNWQIYAAVGSSAMAMATGASAAIIGSGAPVTRDPVASVRLVRQSPAGSGSNGPPLSNNARLAAVLQRQGLPGAPAATSRASQKQVPSIKAGGVVPIYSSVSVIQPGEWVSIFGQNLASQTASWNGDYPTLLGGTSVTINGKLAYLSYVSPSQINLQAPDDTARGTVSVVVTTAAGTAKSSVTLSQFGPSLCLAHQNYVAAIILRPDGSGLFGKGSYDFLGPTGILFGYPTVAASAGDMVEIYAVGLGPTTPTVLAGKPFTGAAPITSHISLYINNVLVEPAFVGLSSAGLYQINLVVPPNLGEGDVPIHVSVGGQETPSDVLFSLRSLAVASTTGGTVIGGGGGTIGVGNGFGSGSGGGTNGGPGTGGGTGGGNGGG